MRLQEEILNQKNTYLNRKGKSGSAAGKRKRGVPRIAVIAWAIIIASSLVTALFARLNDHKGYYRYEDATYYNLDNTWYSYDDSDW